MKICIKCSKCGLPRNGHFFDGKSRLEKQSLIIQKPSKYPVATFQLAAVSIQKVARAFLVQSRRRRNVPVEKWQQKCVHYLYSKGRISKLDGYSCIAVYLAATLQIQTAWRRYTWLKHLRYLNPIIRNRNVVLLQRVWRASFCRRFYIIFNKSVKHPSESTLQCLFGSKVTDLCGNTPSDLHKNVIFHLGISSFPFTLHYQFPSSTKADDDGHGWHIVERDRLTEYICKQKKLQHEATRRRKISKSQSTMRRSKKEDAADLKRERIRKASRKKFQWFYDRKESSEEQPVKDLPFWENKESSEDQPANYCPKPEDKPDEVARDNDDDSDVDVMAWLNDLDFNDSIDDL